MRHLWFYLYTRRKETASALRLDMSRRIYQLPNAQAKIDSPGQNQVRYLLGSVEYPTGEGLYEIYPKKRNEEVSKHLAHLLEMCDGDFCFVVWDNASQHTTPMLLPFLCDNSHRVGLH